MDFLNKTSYEVKPDKLIIDGRHPIDVKIVPILSNQDIVKRGTVLSLTDTGEYIVFGTDLVAPQTSSKVNCIVAEDVDTASSENTVSVQVYISGHFNQNVFTLKNGSNLETGDVEDLRAAGIFVSSSI